MARSGTSAAANAECTTANDHNQSPEDADETTGEYVTISIMSFVGVEILSLSVQSGISVRKLKLEVQAATEIHSSRQRFLHHNSVLEDSVTLESLGVPEFLTFVQLQWKTDEDDFDIGHLVQLHYDGNVVFDSLESVREKGIDQQWKPSMNDMLDRTFKIVKKPAPGIISLPDPDLESQRGSLVSFPESVVRKGEEMHQGDIVRMLSSKEAVLHSFSSSGYRWDDQMKGMLDKEFPILQMTENGIIALPSPDGSQNGMWYFPVSVARRVSADHEHIVKRIVKDCD